MDQGRREWARVRMKMDENGAGVARRGEREEGTGIKIIKLKK